MCSLLIHVGGDKGKKISHFGLQKEKAFKIHSFHNENKIK